MDPHLSEPVDMLPAGQMSTSQSRIALPCVNDKVVQIPYMSMLEPTIDVLKSISGERRVSVPAVAMNYSINKGVVPLLGVRDAEQTEQDMQALGWRLTEDEMKRIEAVSVKGQTSSSLQHG
jgi:glucose-6-phosphate 1-epimerase